MLKIICAGYPRTGTRSFNKAMQLLGYTTIGYSARLIDINNVSFNKYDNIDSAADWPTSYFWRELAERYDTKIVLTTRDENDWFASMVAHTNRTYKRLEHNKHTLEYVKMVHSIFFGTPEPNEYLWKKRFREHNQTVLDYARSGHDVLVLPISYNSPRWEPLCRFLDKPIPGTQYPCVK